MKRLLIALSLVALIPTASIAGDKGLVNKKSKYSVKMTLDKLENVLRKKNITIVTRWSHHAGAKKQEFLCALRSCSCLVIRSLAVTFLLATKLLV